MFKNCYKILIIATIDSYYEADTIYVHYISYHSTSWHKTFQYISIASSRKIRSPEHSTQALQDLAWISSYNFITKIPCLHPTLQLSRCSGSLEPNNFFLALGTLCLFIFSTLSVFPQILRAPSASYLSTLNLKQHHLFSCWFCSPKYSSILYITDTYNFFVK